MDDFELAYADYVIMFPDVASLGTAAATWLTEYSRVKAMGFAETIVTGTTMEGGGGANAIRSFDQKTLMKALHARRAALDDDYAAALVEPAPNIRKPAGIVVRIGP